MQGLKLPHIQLEQINHTHANLLDVRLIISGKRMSSMSHTFKEIYGSSASKKQQTLLLELAGDRLLDSRRNLAHCARKLGSAKDEEE
jgi:hypothetical protein